MFERLRESRWFYVVLSILLAVMFWLYVRAVMDPDQDATLRNIRVETTGTSVLTRQGLTVSGLSEETVDLKIVAPASVLGNLGRYHKEISVVVDVSKCTEGENVVPFEPKYPTTFNTERLITKEKNPETITVTVEKLDTATYPIEFQFNGKVADGYQAGTPAIHPEDVHISGPVEKVSQVAKVVAVLENENLDSRFAGDLPLKLLDAEGNELTDLDVTMDTKTAYVVLPIVVEKELKLSVNFVPGGGATADDIKFKIDPKTITVAGAESDLKELDELSLGSVDLSKILSSDTITFPISLDPSIENVSGINSASVQVTIEGLDIRSFDVNNIVTSNVPDNYKVSLSTQNRTVQVRGKAADLDAIDASQIQIVADMSNITTVGTYPVPVKVLLNASGSVGVVGDYGVVVNVRKK